MKPKSSNFYPPTTYCIWYHLILTLYSALLYMWHEMDQLTRTTYYSVWCSYLYFFYLLLSSLLREWDYHCHTHTVVQDTSLMGFVCVISITSTCVLNKLGVDTVGYSLRGLLSPSGDCSCAGFPFYDFLFLLLLRPLQNHGLLFTCEVRCSPFLFHLSAVPLPVLWTPPLFFTSFQSNWSESSQKSWTCILI